MRKILTALFILIFINVSCSQSDKFEYTVEMPAAFELANILVALTEFGENDDNIIRKNTPYYDSVISYFGPNKDHKIIRRLNELFSKSKWENYKSYNFFRTGSWSYSVKDNQLFSKQLNLSNNLFADFEDEINDFIRKNNYMKFYDGHVDHFNNYTSKYRSNIPVKIMVEWLNNNFPSRYNNYHIVMSPLIGGYHNTINYNNADGDRATFMAVNVPHQFIQHKDFDSYSQGQHIRVVFTEIDHNYVNPVSNNYKRKIKRSIKNIGCWNNGSQSYSSAYLTFNEYMTWATYSIFIRDYFDKEIFEKLNDSVADMMQDYRGFVKFHAFNDHLLNLTSNSYSDQKLESLIPVMLEWMKNQQCSNTN